MEDLYYKGWIFPLGTSEYATSTTGQGDMMHSEAFCKVDLGTGTILLEVACTGRIGYTGLNGSARRSDGRQARWWKGGRSVKLV